MIVTTAAVDGVGGQAPRIPLETTTADHRQNIGT